VRTVLARARLCAQGACAGSGVVAAGNRAAARVRSGAIAAQDSQAVSAVKTPERSVRQRPVLQLGDDLFDDGVVAVGGLGGKHRLAAVGEHCVVAVGGKRGTALGVPARRGAARLAAPTGKPERAVAPQLRYVRVCSVAATSPRPASANVVSRWHDTSALTPMRNFSMQSDSRGDLGEVRGKRSLLSRLQHHLAADTGESQDQRE
jgi:hypothetical protein